MRCDATGGKLGPCRQAFPFVYTIRIPAPPFSVVYHRPAALLVAYCCPGLPRAPAAQLELLEERERELGIEPDPALAAYVTALQKAGKQNIVTDLVLKWVLRALGTASVCMCWERQGCCACCVPCSVPTAACPAACCAREVGLLCFLVGDGAARGWVSQPLPII